MSVLIFVNFKLRALSPKLRAQEPTRAQASHVKRVPNLYDTILSDDKKQARDKQTNKQTNKTLVLPPKNA